MTSRSWSAATGRGMPPRRRPGHRALCRAGHRGRRAADRIGDVRPTPVSPSWRCSAMIWTASPATACTRASRCRCRRTSTRTRTICWKSATSDSSPALLGQLDNISDLRNLGAIVRSVAAFGGHGVVIPAAAFGVGQRGGPRTSAGAAARLPVSRATNLNRTLRLGRRRPDHRRAGRRRRHLTLTSWTGRGRWSSWWARRARVCRDWCGRTATTSSHPDGGPHRVAQRVGGRRRGAGR